MCSFYASLWLSKFRESIVAAAAVAAAAAAGPLVAVVPRVVAPRVVRVPRAAAAVRVLPAPRHALRQVEFIRAIRRRVQSRAREPPLSTHAGACRHTTRHIARITMVHQRCAL